MTVVHPHAVSEPSLHKEFVSEYPYTRSTGPVLAKFFRSLAHGRLLGITSPSVGVIVPPQEYDPATAATLTRDDLVPVGPGGTVTSWTWVAQPDPGNPLDQPFAFALITLDGADTPLLHGVAAAGADAMSTGMRVTARFKPEAERTGDWSDLVCFDPED